MKLAIVTTHPIQYNAPLFKLLAASNHLEVKVFYTWSQSEQGLKYDPGFGREVEWDIPLLQGYNYTFVKNLSGRPGTHNFNGIINPSLINEIENWFPSAMLVFGWSFKSHLKCIRHFYKKIPILFRGDSTLLDERPGIKKLIRFLFLKWVYSHIDYALYVGKNNKEYFLKYGMTESQLIASPHAVDNERFFGQDQQYMKQAQTERLKLGIINDDLVLLFAGKFEKKKNPFFLLELAKRIKDKRLKILFVGNGELEKSLKIASESDQRIFFLDFCNQSKMPVIYRTGDVFILPSSGPGETWGLAINEAMACGLPIMVSDKVGGAVDLVDEPLNGIIFNTNDIQKCVHFLNNLLADNKALVKMKNASKQLIQQFSYEQTVTPIFKLFKDI